MLTRPLADFTHNTRIGLVDVSPASDGLVRGIVHADEFGGETHGSAVSQLADMSGFETGVEYPIDFSIAPESFTRVSYLNVLDGDIDGLAGKTVFVGATALELDDTVAVPVHGALPRCRDAGHRVRDAARRRSDAGAALGHRRAALLVCLTIPLLRALSWRKTTAIALIGAGSSLLAAIVLDCVADSAMALRFDVMPFVFAVLLSARRRRCAVGRSRGAAGVLTGCA